MKAATKGLEDAVEGYLTVAMEGDITGLIPRPSPFKSRLIYRWIQVMDFLTKNMPSNSNAQFERKHYSTPCSA